jgi:hypothetical protein
MSSEGTAGAPRFSAPASSVEPILVTGSHRSGTTWAGRMLGQSRQTAYLHEPFCPARSPGWLTEPLPFWFMYLNDENCAPYLKPIQRVMELRFPTGRSLLASHTPREVARQIPEIARSMLFRMRGLRPLLKDPFALFSSEWLADRFGARPVILIRKPVAFVGSIKRLNWGFDYEQNWLAQPLLIRDHLARHASRFENYEGEVDLVGEGVVMWNALYDFVGDLRDRRPDFIYVRYEDLAVDPLTGYEKLYVALGLRWDERVRERIRSFSDTANPKDVSARKRREIKRDSRAAAETWRHRLSPDEVDRITRETASVAARFYPD